MPLLRYLGLLVMLLMPLHLLIGCGAATTGGATVTPITSAVPTNIEPPAATSITSAVPTVIESPVATRTAPATLTSTQQAVLPAPSAATPSPIPALQITYQRSGGLAGMQESLTIATVDGQAVFTRRKQHFTKTLSPAVVAQLLAQFKEADFLALAPEYLPTDPCCDRIDYRIGYNDHIVHTMDGAIPKAIQPIIDTLNAVMAEFGV
jgi:hypothetical protein